MIGWLFWVPHVLDQFLCWESLTEESSSDYSTFIARRHFKLQTGNILCFVAQSCPTLCDPVFCGWPGSSVCGILQARILEWVAIPFCTRSSWPRAQTCFSCIEGRFFTIWTTREIPQISKQDPKSLSCCCQVIKQSFDKASNNTWNTWFFAFSIYIHCFFNLSWPNIVLFN